MMEEEEFIRFEKEKLSFDFTKRNVISPFEVGQYFVH